MEWWLNERCKVYKIDNPQYVMKNELIILKALADETRLKIVEFLLGGEKCVCENGGEVL